VWQQDAERLLHAFNAKPEDVERVRGYFFAGALAYSYLMAYTCDLPDDRANHVVDVLSDELGDYVNKATAQIAEMVAKAAAEAFKPKPSNPQNAN
jgi:hypothetical protein